MTHIKLWISNRFRGLLIKKALKYINEFETTSRPLTIRTIDVYCFLDTLKEILVGI